ncbi:hypothetical protein BsWGS_21724 [Bradybaena similaris]
MLTFPALVAFMFLPLLSLGQNLRQQTCTKGNAATIQPGANAWIGGILSLNKQGTGGFGCGQPTDDMQAYEAIRWVLELLNKKNELLQTQLLTDYYVPGIRLGMKVRNYCSNELSSLASLMDIYPELNTDDEACNPLSDNFTLGILGASSSGDAISLSDSTVDYKIPVVSYEATATQLTLSGKHPNFMRTISPDGPLMEVIARVMTTLQWKFVVVVYDSDDYSRQAFTELHARLIASGICLTASIMVDADDESTAADTVNRVLSANTTGVLYIGPSNYAKAIINAGNGMLPAAGRLQWLVTDMPLDTVFASSSVYQRGIISISAASRFIVEFEDHWIRINETNPSLENPWFTGWYENKYSCKFSPAPGQVNCNSLYQGLSDTDKELKKRADYQQSHNVEAAIMAVYTYARALRTAQMALCPGVSGACAALQAMSRETFMNNYVKKVNFTFTADERVPSLASNNVPPYNSAKHLRFTAYGDVMDPSYYIYNFNDIDTGGATNDFRFRRVGSYIGSYFDFNINNVGMYSENRLTRIPLPSSPCPALGCMPCLGLPADIKYYFETGDVVVHGIFSLHQMGITPLTCGPMMSVNQYMFMEAMIYAIRKVNLDSTILNNVNLGGLGMDDCSSTVLGQAFLSQVQRGNLKIVDISGSELNPRKIEAYSAAHTTQLTLPLAEAMNSLMRPMVGYRAGGSKLDDRSSYPYYIRAVPGHQDEMRAIVELLRNKMWMFVQVVTSNTEYSQDTENVFRQLASRAGICIVATHNIGQTNQDADDVVTGLNYNSGAPVAVVLLESQDIRRLLITFNNSNTAKIVLIGTSVWGTDYDVVKDLQVLPGIITLNIKSSTLDTFKAYLSNLNVNTYMLNPWFKEWYVAAHNCSLGGQGTGAPCNLSQPITAGVNFKLMHEVEGVINAIRAIGYGLDSMLHSVCGPSYSSICSDFLTYKNKGMVFLEAIRRANFSIEDMASPNTFSFVGNSAAIPFQVNNYVLRNYVLLGEINLWAGTISLRPVKMNDQQDIVVTPTCVSPCTECLFMANYFDYWYIPGDVIIGGIFDIHNAGNGPFSCGALRVKNGALYTEVFNFALQSINSGMASVKLRNVSLGGLAFDGCTSPHRAKAIVNQVHAGMNIRDSLGNMFMSTHLVSWMSYDSQTTIDTASLVQKINMPLVSPGATASELDDKKKYYTFFRTIPSDSVVVRGMAEFVRDIGKKFVVVLNAPDTSNRESRDLFRKYLTDFGICIVANYEFVTDGSMDAIVSNIDNAQTQIVAVFAEPEMYISDFLEAKNKDLRINPLIYISNRPWKFPRQQATLVKSVYFELSVPTFTDFKTYLDSRAVNNNNPWFSEIYEKVMDCNLPGTFTYTKSCSTGSITSGDWEQDIWTLSTINAVYALAEGVHRTLQAKCGAAYTSVCPAFLYDNDVHNTIMSNMDAENFTDITASFFQFIQREANTKYKLMRIDSAASTVLEGSLDSVGALSLQNKDASVQLYAPVISECNGDCLVCSAQISNLQDYTLVPGDFYIIGLFDIHKQGTTPFTCGAINYKHGLLLQEAFNYALEVVNTKSGMFKNVLQGVVLGGVSFDICQSPSRAAEIVANIHSGNIQISKGGVTVNPRRIDAYVATMDTESSIRVADILTQLDIPQVSYGAKGMDLLNRDKYSYFLRSVPADDKQARAMVSYLKKFNYNNIQVINSFDTVGKPGEEEFKRLAYVNKICITKEYTVGENRSVATDAVSVVRLIQQNPDASVVVLWLKNPLPVLEEVSKYDTVTSNFLFIATDAWGADNDYLTLSSISSLLSKQNLVILDVETADVPGFDAYLEYKTPNNYLLNPWFKEYFESFLKCLSDPSIVTGPQKCDPSATIPRADNYKQDSYVLYVINAVFSIALGIEDAIRTLCVGQPPYGSCNLYVTSGERRQKIKDGLLKVNFTDDTHQPFYFTEDGQSSRGFHVFNITKPSSGFEYQTVGSYNDTNFLKLDITYDTNFKAHCDVKPGGCVCNFTDDLPSRYMKKPDGGRGLSIVYIGDVHQASTTNPLGCGPINTGADLQKLLAFFYAIEQVNSNRVFSNSLKLDGLALDSCSNGLRLGQDVYNVLSGNVLCDSDNDGLLVSPSTITAVVVDKDENAEPVVSMLSRQNITSISPTAGSSLLNDRFVYPYFLRINGDNIQTSNVILDIAHAASWNYLSVVYTDTLGYSNMADSLLDTSRQSQACVGVSIPLSPTATLEDAQYVLQRLSQQVGARAVVLFVKPDQVKLLLQASQSLGLTGRFVWVIASDWDQDMTQLAGFEQELAGALVISGRNVILANFIAYFKRLTYKNRGGIPDDWFEDIYETLHQCNILNLERPSSYRYSRTCTLDEVITDSMIKQDPDVLYVILSVYSVAFGLANIPECVASSLDLSACLQLQPQRYDKIYKGISTTSFQIPELGNDSFTFTFDDNGNGQAGYNIWNYHIGSDVPYSLYKVGDYTNGLLTFRKDLYAGSNLYDRAIPSSECAVGSVCTCQLSGSAGSRTWSYSAAQMLDPSNVVVGGLYKDPVTGEVVRVEAIPDAGDRFSEGWAIVLSILACLGGVVSLAIFVYLLIMYPVRGGTTILGFILSFGIVLLYMMAFPFIAHADVRMCGLRRFGLGFVYSIVYSALMVKLIDCWRVRAKNDPYNIKYSKLGTPVGFFLVTVFFILVQVIINAEWLILREPGITRIFYQNQFWPRCTPDDFYDESLVLSLVYIMVIILVSLLLGLATYRTVKNHRESRWILGILVVSVICWVIWCTASILGAKKMRDAAVVVGLLVNATTMLLLMPIRKLYLLHKYKVTEEDIDEEEDKQSTIALSQKGTDYNSVYGRQYDNNPKMHDSGSVQGSSHVYNRPSESAVNY